MSHGLNPRFTLDALVVGSNNRDAVAAGKSVAEQPGRTHNPLFIHGDTGLGKSHVLMAVGAAAVDANPEMTCRYLSFDDFANEFDDANANGTLEEFRHSLHVDILLVDDVQHLGHRQATQEEFARLLVIHHDRGGQSILTSDRPLAEIENLDSGLLATLGGGLVVALGAPDIETRKEILVRRSAERGVELGDDVVDVVATGDFGNVRELLGLLNRLIAFQAVSEHPLTPESARALVIGDSERAPAPAPAPNPATATPVPLVPVSQTPEDEFGFFMSGVTATVNEQVERLGGRIREAIEKWGGLGYRTAVLETALQMGEAADVDDVLGRYEEAVAGLRALQHQMAECDPEQAGNPVFKDPNRLAEATDLVRRAQSEFEPPPGPSEAFNLDEFLESDDSKMAVAAARSIASDPGTHYNPFVIVGGSGQGKTHLLHGIGRKLEETTESIVACVSAQAFVEQLVQAIDENRIPSWRARYRRAKALLLDNIDLLGERQRIQEELFFLFNVMEEAGNQLVFTSNVPPRQISGLDERLQSRLEGGLIVTLEPPDQRLRRAVIVQQFTHRSGAPDDDLADFLAEQHADSVRSVLGIGHRVLTAAEARGVAPSRSLAEEVLAPEQRDAPNRSSGVIVLPSGGMEHPEKVVQRWPDPVAAIIEDFR